MSGFWDGRRALVTGADLKLELRRMRKLVEHARAYAKVVAKAQGTVRQRIQAA